MPTNLPVDRLRGRIRAYLGRVPATEIKDDEPTAVVLAPVEVGVSRFIDVDNLPNLKDIPFIPERMRDFAFRYATEYKPYKVWAKEYGVEVRTLYRWLQHEGVRAYIAITRFEQRMFNLAQHVILQRNVNKTINAILSTKITADTIGAIGQMARFMHDVLANPSAASDPKKGIFNVNIGYPAGAVTTVERSPYAQEPRDVTPKELEELKADIEELEIIAEGFGNNGDKDE